MSRRVALAVRRDSPGSASSSQRSSRRDLTSKKAAASAAAPTSAAGDAVTSAQPDRGDHDAAVDRMADPPEHPARDEARPRPGRGQRREIDAEPARAGHAEAHARRRSPVGRRSW